ncbi:MAG: hypothetical protein H0W36_12740 [Gemmatimonadetes bacterium]|nr:hypothetical protein [Gemmatimonadota bacterium]
MNGILSIVDRDAGAEIALIQSGIRHRAGDGSILAQHAAVLTEDEERLYVPTGSDGLLVYDLTGADSSSKSICCRVLTSVWEPPVL